MRPLRFVLLIVFILVGCSSPPTATPTLPLTPTLPQTLAPTSTSSNKIVTFPTEDGVTLSGTVYGSGFRAVVLSNVGDGTQADWREVAQQFAQKGYLAFTYDWRGLGASTSGRADYTRADKDLRAGISFLRPLGVKRIVLIGASLGGMASVMNSDLPELAGAIIIGSPRQAPNFEITAQQINMLTAPKLFIASRGDRVVAYNATVELYEATQGTKEFVTYESTAHGTELLKTSDGADLWQRLLKFVSTNMP